MITPSNLYAEKIFSEQPIALWALDDKADFVSLIDSADKAMSGWTVVGSGSIAYSVTQAPQVLDSPIIGIVLDDDTVVSATSTTFINSSSLDRDKNTFTISTYIKGDAQAEILLGYVIEGSPVFETFQYSPQTDQNWAFLSKEFSLPALDKDLAIYISIKQDVSLETTFYLNNISVGQWTESFATVSSGVVPQPLSAYQNTTLSTTTYALPAKPYGLSDNDAYYLSSNNKLLSYNEGFPMVYGASSVTKILNGHGEPSLIIPGNGFLNDSGKFLDLTAEFWIRISPNSMTPSRVFGPISSSDGVYVNGEFITIKIGSVYGSHFIGEWGRPMLLHFRVSETTASLLIDGEQVISISIDANFLDFPKPFSALDASQDWLGFYSYSHIDSFEVDCIAIYGYQIPELVAKRRFVYGQGVEFPELSSSSLIGASSFIDYKVADYAKNYIYPDIGRWTQGLQDNALVQGGVLKTPIQPLPRVILNNKNITEKRWLSLCSEYIEDQYGSLDISLANSPTGSGGYLYLDNINPTSSEIHVIYGVFKTTSTSDQTLFSLVNSVSGHTFKAELSSNKITYTFSDGVENDIVFQASGDITLNEIFAAGVNVKNISKKYGGRVSRFFGSLKNVGVYLAGQQDLKNTFAGRVYRFGISSQRNAGLIESYFDSNKEILNVTDQTDAAQLLLHTATYTLKPTQYIDDFVLDVACNTYWQDYVPLSYMAGSVLNAENSYDKSLQFIQFNVFSPSIFTIAEEKHDTSNSQVKTYITFQYLQSGPNEDHTRFLYTESLPEDKVVYPGPNWRLTRYEVMDDTVIYFPTDANYNSLALVTHIEINAQSSISDQVKIKNLELASQALSDIQPTEIPTRFGDKLFAFTLRGVYPDYSSKNPVSIYKGSTPYLYLTNNSGIKMKGILKDNATRAIRSRVNEQRSNLYRVGAVQMLVRYYENSFPVEPKKLITFTARNKTVSLYVKSSNESNTRGVVYALNDNTGLPDQTIYFYSNGKLVKDLFLLPKSWDMIGIQFKEALDFNSSIGYIDIAGPILVHGISNYRLTSSQDSATSILRNWSQIRTMIGGGVTYWGDFLEPNPITTWENVLYIPTLRTYLIDPRVAFSLYTGTNKIIVGDGTRLRFNRYEYRIYNDIVWQSDILDAV